MKAKKLDPYTLRLSAKDMAAKARSHVSRGRQHGPMSRERWFHNGAASALEHEVKLMRFVARQLTKEARRLEKGTSR